MSGFGVETLKVDEMIQETEKVKGKNPLEAVRVSISSLNSYFCDHLSEHLTYHMKPCKCWSQGA